MSINPDKINGPLTVECMDCGHTFDWAKVLGPCPECGCTTGSYNNRPVTLKTGHEDE